MKKIVILRSVTGNARKWADRNLRYFTWYDDVDSAVAGLKSTPKADRPWHVVVDAGTGVTGSKLTSLGMGMGYIVETKGVT